METMFDTLLQLPLFQGLCHEDFTNILEKVKLHFVKHKVGDIIIKDGTECDRLLFLLKGEVSAITSSKDETFTFVEQIEAPYVVEPYSLFGMNTNYVSSYVTRSETHTVSVSKSFVLTDLFKYDIFRLNYMNIISNRAQSMCNRLWEETPRDLEDKIIRFIQMHTQRSTGTKFLKIKMDDLARVIDDTRLNVSKSLNALQEQNLIVLHRKEIEVPELSMLVDWNLKRVTGQ